MSAPGSISTFRPYPVPNNAPKITASSKAKLEEITAAYGATQASIRELKAAKNKAEAKSESYKNKVLLAKDRGELGGFQSKASDTKCRNAELSVYLESDEEAQLLEQAADKARTDYEEANDLLAQMRFVQRAAQNIAADDFTEAVERWRHQVKIFASAVDLFVATRKSA